MFWKYDRLDFLYKFLNFLPLLTSNYIKCVFLAHNKNWKVVIDVINY